MIEFDRRISRFILIENGDRESAMIRLEAYRVAKSGNSLLIDSDGVKIIYLLINIIDSFSEVCGAIEKDSQSNRIIE